MAFGVFSVGRVLEIGTGSGYFKLESWRHFFNKVHTGRAEQQSLAIFTKLKHRLFSMGG